MSEFFHEILYRPLFNLLILLYQTVAFKDLGIAIILVTLVIRFLLFPLFYKGFKNQTILQRLQPEIKRIQEEHKGDKEKQGRALLDLYKTHKVNPFSSLALLIVQLPILIALYKVFLNDFTQNLAKNLYTFVSTPASIDPKFLGLIDLSKRSIIIVVLAAVFQYWQGKLSLGKAKTGGNSPADRVGRQMIYLGPILTVVFLYSLPAAVGLYWLVTSIFSVGQQFVINRRLGQPSQSHGIITHAGGKSNQETRP